MMDEYFAELLRDAQKRFPGAVCVDIRITGHEVTVTPEYRGELDGYTMQTVGGQWCSIRKTEDE